MLVASLRTHLTSPVEPFILETNLDTNHQENHFIYGLNVIPHPSKRAKGGEDSYYVAEKYQLCLFFNIFMKNIKKH